MGHYYSEMCCPKCSEIRCVCPEVLERERKYARMSQKERDREYAKMLLDVLFNESKEKK